jgi:D-alanine transaminase
MEKIWINGKTLPLADARINVEDRGFQFADGVYEVIRIYNRQPFTLREHLARLERSCAGIDLSNAFNSAELAAEISRFIEINGPTEGMVYLQITRGVAPRNHIVADDMKPTILFYTRPLSSPALPGEGVGIKLFTVPDDRWQRCWIKAIALLPNVLAKNVAVRAGADEAVFLNDQIVTECSASNLFAIRDGHLCTHPIGAKVLPGITRLLLQDIAAQLNIQFSETPFTEKEAMAADELFITSTTRELNWVSHWNGGEMWSGCGPITRQLHAAYVARVRAATRSRSAAAVA